MGVLRRLVLVELPRHDLLLLLQLHNLLLVVLQLGLQRLLAAVLRELRLGCGIARIISLRVPFVLILRKVLLNLGLRKNVLIHNLLQLHYLRLKLLYF